jgi:Bacterial regulatory helix-turn-helix protein, lysR family
MHLCYGSEAMDLRALRSFVVVADYAGFSRAAEHLGISQPARLAADPIKQSHIELALERADLP